MASHLVDQVLPYKPLRQWVLSFPFPLRLLFAKDPQLIGLVLNLVLRAISSSLIKKAGFKKKSGAKKGFYQIVPKEMLYCPEEIQNLDEMYKSHLHEHFLVSIKTYKKKETLRLLSSV